MRYQNLGRTGVKVSALCLGCMNFGGRTNAAESARIIAAALGAGINFIDLPSGKKKHTNIQGVRVSA